MNPIERALGILLLLGVYKGGIYGGSITAILINTPGTPPAACTVLDGYPLARRGEAKRALDIALYSSCFADFMSNLALIGLAGFLAAFALRFGPPEFFTLIVFSLTIIAGVSGNELARETFAERVRAWTGERNIEVVNKACARILREQFGAKGKSSTKTVQEAAIWVNGQMTDGIRFQDCFPNEE